MYSSPYCEISTPSGSFDRCITQAVVSSSRHRSATIAEICLDNRNLDFNGICSKEDEIEILMGYWGIGKWLVFSGTVQTVESGNDYIIKAKNDMLKAHETRIVKAFTDATPNDVVTHCLNEAGYSKTDLGGSDLPQKKHFVLRNATVTEAIALVERTWGITGWGSYITSEGVFTWKPWEEPSECYVFQTGVNVFDFEPYSDMWRLHTFLLPWIEHSSVVRVEDERLGYETKDCTFRVERVTLQYGRGNSMYLWLRKLDAVKEADERNVFGNFQLDY